MTMTTHEMAGALAPAQANAAPRQRFAAIRATLAMWRKRLAERALLARMDEREIRDLGISVADVVMEINKPFWRG